MSAPLSPAMVYRRDALFAVFVVAVLVMMLVPIPYLALDLFLTLSVTLSLLILFVAINLRKPLDFSVFPAMLLLVTLFRLALSVAATRLILLAGADFDGKLIRALGSFLLQGNAVVGFVIFIVIFVVQLKVVTAGATRIAEVAARFTLDALPGRQLAIVSDLNAGLLTESEAQARRNELNQQADFYGAMDGAFRFVRGDAIANVFIALVNMVGGLLIGVFSLRLPFQEAVQIYAILTVGSGLVSQIPSLIISVASGLVITKAASSELLGRDLGEQLFLKPKALQWTSVVLLMLIFMGMPPIPFLILSAASFALSLVLRRSEKRKSSEESGSASSPSAPSAAGAESECLQVDLIELEIGYGLIGLVDRETEEPNLVSVIGELRRKLAHELGLIVPAIRIRDNLKLGSQNYRVKIKGGEVAKGELRLGEFCVVGSAEEFRSKRPCVQEPAVAVKGWWIDEADRRQALSHSYEVLAPLEVLMQHLEFVLQRFAHEFLTRQEVKLMLDQLQQKKPAVVDDLIPQVVSLTLLHRILKNLLREGVPIRDLVTILETLAEYAPRTDDAEVLTEYVRQALARSISERYRSTSGRIHVLTLDPVVEEKWASLPKQAGELDLVSQDPELIRSVIDHLRQHVHALSEQGITPILLCRPSIRKSIHRITEKVLPDLVVLSLSEIAPDVELEAQGVAIS